MRALPGLYAILDLGREGSEGRLLQLLDDLLAAGVRLFQLRAKDLGSGDLLALSRRVARRCHERRGVWLVVNDRLDVALAAGADGAHLGALDLPVSAARKLAPTALIGATVRSPGGARRAVTAGADYVAVGPMAPTRTKSVPGPLRSLEDLGEVARAAGQVPVVAVGGIGVDLAEPLYRAGARSLAVAGALSRSPKASETVKAFRRAERRALKSPRREC